MSRRASNTELERSAQIGANPNTVAPIPSRSVEIVEVSPRDGLQNEAVTVPTADKVVLVRKLIAAGARRIEVASFVNPQRVPQMADAEAVLAALPEHDDVIYIGLVLNDRGLERALATKVDQIGTVCLTTDSFALRNQKQTAVQSLDIASQIVRRAFAAGRSAQITIAASFGCPFEGEVASTRVVELAKRAADAQPCEIALADTIGVAVPLQVTELVQSVREAIAPIPVRVHLHDTRGTGIANAWAALSAGANTLDASLGGLGGCPFAPGAAGNIATENLAYLLERSGVATGLDLDAIIEQAGWLARIVGKPIAGVAKAGSFPAQPA